MVLLFFVGVCFIGMAYSVVEFQLKDIVNGEEQVTKEVEIVASSWIHGDDKLCWWPGSCSSLSAEKMARRRVEVRDPSKWNQYGIKILYRTGKCCYSY